MTLVTCRVERRIDILSQPVIVSSNVIIVSLYNIVREMNSAGVVHNVITIRIVLGFIVYVQGDGIKRG